MRLDLGDCYFPHIKRKDPTCFPFLALGITIGFHRQLFNSCYIQGNKVSLPSSGFKHEPTAEGPHITHKEPDT